MKKINLKKINLKKINLKDIALIIRAVLSGICYIVSFFCMILMIAFCNTVFEIESLDTGIQILFGAVSTVIMLFFGVLSIFLFFSWLESFKINDKRPTSREEALIIAHGERCGVGLSTVEVGIFSSKVSEDYYLKIVKESSYNDCEPGFDKISKSYIPLERNYFENHTVNDLISLIEENVNTALEFDETLLISIFERSRRIPSSEILSCIEEGRIIADNMPEIKIYIARETYTVNTRKRCHGIIYYHFSLRILYLYANRFLTEEVLYIKNSFFKSYDKLSNFIYSEVRDRLYYKVNYYKVNYLALNEAALKNSLKDAEFYLSLNKKRKENAK